MKRTDCFLIGCVFGALLVFSIVMATAFYVEYNKPPVTQFRLKDSVAISGGVYDGRQGFVVGYDYESRLYVILDTQGLKFEVPAEVLGRGEVSTQVHIVEQTEEAKSA